VTVGAVGFDRRKLAARHPAADADSAKLKDPGLASDSHRWLAPLLAELGRVLINRHQLYSCEECLLYPPIADESGGAVHVR
jgi:hypothetical protein